MMEYWKVNKRSERLQYRCSAKHLAMIEAIKAIKNKDKNYRLYSSADILEIATDNLYELLTNKKAASFKV